MIQNDIVDVIASCIKKEQLSGLEKSRYFAIIADEVTDQHANKEVLCFCIRFVEQGKEAAQIKEVFLNFVSLERTTGQAIGDSFLELLKKENLDVWTGLRRSVSNGQ